MDSLPSVTGNDRQAKTNLEVGRSHTSLFEQFQLQPPHMPTCVEGNVIHIAPVGIPNEQHQVTADLPSFNPAVPSNTLFPTFLQPLESLQQPQAAVLNSSSTPVLSELNTTSVSRAQATVPLQNVDAETAKNILGRLVQVLQHASQLPQDEAFQRLVQMSSGPSGSDSDTMKQATDAIPQKENIISKSSTKVGVKRKHSRSFHDELSTDFMDSFEVKSEIIDESYEDSDYFAKHELRPCKVRLEKLTIKTDSKGRIVIPKTGNSFDLKKMLDINYSKLLSTQKSNKSSVLKSIPASGDSSNVPDSIKVSLMPNMNEALDHSVRTMYMGPTEDVMQWLTIVWWRNSRFLCQCIFCPFLADAPKTIVKHLRDNHCELLFALNKKELLGVLSGSLHPDIRCDVKLELVAIPSNETIRSPTSYVCFDCFKVSTDSKALAMHVLRDHVDTLNCNGCFVKLMMIQKPPGRPSLTYNQAISDPELSGCRYDVFICMLCDLCVKCPYSVLSHTLSCHQKRYLLLVCSQCSYHTISDDRMIEHLCNSHNAGSQLVCSATIISKANSRFSEMPVRHNRKKSLDSVNAVLARGDDGPPKKKQKTSSGKCRTPIRNGVQKSKTAKTTKKSTPKPSKAKTVQSKSVSSSKTKTAKKGYAKVKKDSSTVGIMSMEAVEDEVASVVMENANTGCIVEDVEYRITLAEDDTNCDSDNEEMDEENCDNPSS